MGKADVAREARILREPLNTYEAMTFDAGGWVMMGGALLRLANILKTQAPIRALPHRRSRGREESMDAKAGQGYAKHAWLIIFVYALLSVIASPINLLGAPPNPPSPERETGLSLDQMDARMPGLRGYISAISRQLGNFLLGMAVLLMGIAAVPYRKGERWAWLVCWILPVNLVIQIANSLSAGGFLWQVDLAFLLVVLAGLLLPFRRFIPKGG